MDSEDDRQNRRGGSSNNRGLFPRRGDGRDASREGIKDKGAPYRKHDYSLKFLLPNHLAGVMIGNGGSLIKELIEITGADVHVSNNTDPYPGTKDRVVYIAGNEASVTLTQSLIWEMIGQQTYANEEGKRSLAWHPAAAKANPGDYDDVRVEGKITIPEQAGGAIIGKGGSTIRTIAKECGVELAIDGKEDCDYYQTHERVVTLRGTVSGCMNCTFRILNKLSGLKEDYYYYHSGTLYGQQAVNRGRDDDRRDRDRDRDVGRGRGQERDRGLDRRRDRSRDRERSRDEYDDRSRTRDTFRDRDRGGLNLFDSFHSANLPVETIRANTTIEVAVPDRAVGAIVGVAGARLQEIRNMSGAEVVISKRGEYLDGTNNRIVTITGTPACAQTAHTLILHVLRTNADDF